MSNFDACGECGRFKEDPVHSGFRIGRGTGHQFTAQRPPEELELPPVDQSVRGLVIHVASFPMRIGTRLRQRCSWCPEILIDLELADLVQDAQGMIEAPKTWVPGRLVARENGVDREVDFDTSEDLGPQLSPDCCMMLPAELTQ